MLIVTINDKRILINDETKLDISDGSIIQYTGIHYKSKNEPSNMYDIEEITTEFIGQIETERGDSEGTTGIYVVPLYLWDSEWLKIANYAPPKNKYFLYPHLLMLPDKYYHYQPLYFLDTCEKADLNKFANVTKMIKLEYID